MKKKSLVILGLNSGTSADGVDLAAIEIKRGNKAVKINFLKGKSIPYPQPLHRRIINLADANVPTLEEMMDVDNTIGNFFGKTAVNFLTQLQKENVKVNAVASHGQTVRHQPLSDSKKNIQSSSLQLGSLDFIAKHTGTITIGDFRQADIALGNEGAPITVAAMQRLFGSAGESRLIVNVGGVSNYFYFPSIKKSLKPLAADCGPGNSLCDILAEKLFHKRFDSSGEIARKGNPSVRVLTLLLAEPFFRNSAVSTGRETFGKNYAEKIIQLGRKLHLNKEDIMSTAAELTVIAIANKVRPLFKKDKKLKKLYLTGGGRKNRFFVKRLRMLLPGTEIEMADKLGINADYIEAAAYAVMGEAVLRSEPLPTLFTGKNQKMLPVLGKIVQPPVKV